MNRGAGSSANKPLGFSSCDGASQQYRIESTRGITPDKAMHNNEAEQGRPVLQSSTAQNSEAERSSAV